MPFIPDRESAWKFVTFGSGGAAGGAGVQVGANLGVVVLKDPSGTQTDFWYGGLGAGAGFGGKIKLGKINVRLKGGGSAGPTAFPSTGIVFLEQDQHGTEPTASALRGPCVYVEAGAGLLLGGSGTAMFMGCNPLWFASLAAGPLGAPLLVDRLIASAKLMVLMAGVNAGVQAGGGIMAYIGGVI